MNTYSSDDLMNKIVSLAKRRGFIFQSSEIYGGLRSAYDYGPLGVELKRNLMNEWWRFMVHEREDIVGLDASIIMHPKVWEASGHLAGFSDPLVDCFNCKERFRSDKAPKQKSGDLIEYIENGKKKGKKLKGTVQACGYVCPKCNSPDISNERQFNLMLQTKLGSIDSLGDIVKYIKDNSTLSMQEIILGVDEIRKKNNVYLRPETAQAIFVQFMNIQQTMSLKIPFGVAQMGKSFRNEITVEHFIFRSCEFEQMEMEFFIEPNTQEKWLSYWCDTRLLWWKKYANIPNDFRIRKHTQEELAHYADACYDIEYAYPWGFDELEGIASRTDYDLKKHQEASGQKLNYFDPQKVDPKTNKLGYRFTPYVIEPAAGATRGVLAYLLDAYTEETTDDSKGMRSVLKLHPRLAPIKVAILPLVKKEGMPEIAREIVQTFLKSGISARYDEQHAIGKRYRRHDEIGTPYCITIDGDTKKDDKITIRDRNTMEQERIPLSKALDRIKKLLDI